MFKISQKVKILSLPLLGLLTALSPTAVQAYETFSVKGGSVDMALNTNSKFSRIDGTPRMSLWSRNDSDSDQQFERIAIGNGSFLLKHRTTGQCLNAHYLANGKELNVWGCNASDPDQNFDLVGLSDDSNLIRRRGTNLCVDSPTRDNGGKVHLWACDANNTNQKWRSSNTPPLNNVVVKPGIINLTFGRGYQWITSTNYKFVFQTDGNLVLYTPQGKAIWATGTNNTGADMLAVQTDGNVVLYDHGKAVWATDTAGLYGNYLAIQVDGNIVVYTASNTPIYSTSTDGGRTGSFTASADWIRKHTQTIGLMVTSTIMAQLINGQLLGQYKDVDGAPLYQCWDFVAYATGINSSSKYWLTTNWKAGANVMSSRNIAIGTAIATFAGPNGKYDGGSYQHTAIFAGYDTVNGVSGFWVWDQNFDANLNGDRSIKKHFIRNNSSGSSNANNYYLITI